MISFLKQDTAGPAYILAVTGDYGRVETALARSLLRLEKIAKKSDCQVIVALEDVRWESLPLVRILPSRFAPNRLTVVRGRADQPGPLFNAAARLARRDFLHFLWPGCLPVGRAVRRACAAATARKLDWLAFADEAAEELPEICNTDSSGNPFLSNLLACGNYLELAQAVIRRATFLELGGFDPSPILQRQFDADFWLRSARHGHRSGVDRGRLAEVRWTWEKFPLERDFRAPSYLAQSYRVRMASRPVISDRAGAVNAFAADLPPTLRRTMTRLCPATRPDESPAPANGISAAKQTPYRIAVTGGSWDFIHNQLCFFNHFQELEGQGLFTYVPLLDRLIVPERDLLDMDLVIISRGRDTNLLKVLDYCRDHSTATITMIDDNWFSVGTDWPDPYATTFAPGLPQFEMFLTCLRESDAALVYNDILAEDVQPYARRVIQLPTNVRDSDFTAPLRNPDLKTTIDSLTSWRKETGGLVAGYIGSLRFCDSAFKALAALEARRQSIKIVLFGVVSEEQRQLFGGRAISLPCVSYDHYAAAVGALAPDILVAPLDDSRTSRSKCPNKYLEYSMAGAAGVYSRVSVYLREVDHGRTGMLVEDDREDSWLTALARLVDDAPLRKSIAAAARQDVLARFSTRSVAPAFAQAVLSVLQGRGRERYGPREAATC